MHLMRQRNDNAKASEQEVLAHFLAFLCIFPQDSQGGVRIATMEGSVVGGVRTSDDERRLELGLAGSDGTGSAGEWGMEAKLFRSHSLTGICCTHLPSANSRNNLC